MAAWFLLLRAPVQSQPEASVERWLSALNSEQWCVPRATTSLRETALDLLFRWSDGAQRDDRWSFIDLERGAARADGTVTLVGPDLDAARVELTVLNATPELARATFIALALATEDAVGILCEVGVGSSAGENLGCGGTTEAGWLTCVPGDRTDTGPYHRVERLGSTTIVEAYALDGSEKIARILKVETWLRNAPGAVSTAALEIPPLPHGPKPAIAAPSYLVTEEAQPASMEPEPSRTTPSSGGEAGPGVGPLAAFAKSAALSTATEPLDLARVRAALAAGVVPFAGATSPERLAALRESPTSIEADQTVAANADADSTMFMPTAASRAIANEASDFSRDLRKVPIPDLSIDHYAALSVEIELKGATSEVLRRHGIPSAASLEALQAEQGRRMLADPGLRRAFDERRAHFLRFAREPRR